MAKPNLQPLKDELLPVLDAIVEAQAALLKKAVENLEVYSDTKTMRYLVAVGLLQRIRVDSLCGGQVYTPTREGLNVYTKIYGVPESNIVFSRP